MTELIQWPRAKYWEKTFDPVIGCRKRSEGCVNCWACEFAKRFRKLYGDACDWDGTLYYTNAKPPKSGVVFCGNMSEWFDEKIPDEKILNWIHYLNCTATNLILTKEAERLNRLSGFWRQTAIFGGLDHYFGVTAENQERFEERCSLLLNCHFRNKWLSLEPLLGAIDLTEKMPYQDIMDDGETMLSMVEPLDFIDWVVVGGESVGSRPGQECKLEWIEQIVEQCQEAGVSVFVKQLHIGGKLVKHHAWTEAGRI